MEFIHKSIMLQECMEMLKVKPDGKYLDGTVGGGGHSYEIARRLSDKGMLIGVDKDADAIEAADKRLGELSKNVKLVHSDFSEIKRIVEEEGCGQVDGILLDLGVSSYQLDNAERGFSYQADAGLDMRMDKRQGITAEFVVNEYQKEDLIRIIKTYGEEKWAARIAEYIIRHRKVKRIKTTGQLVDIIKQAVPAAARREGPHPAKRTFQAIRIEVNNELNILKGTIEDGVECLRSEGRICIITFHSLEDRIVKQTFNGLQESCTCPPDFPVCMCSKKSLGKVVNRKPIEPSQEEVGSNPRARSAKLRVFEKR